MSVRGPRATTAVAGIIGWPVDHSLSPAIHNAAFAAAGLDWTYVAFGVAPGSLGAAVAGMRALGIRGLNVTMPHKVDVMPYLDDVAEEAERIGAVNTIVRSGDRLIGANTDGTGFVRFLERDAGRLPRRAVVLGAGGSARAVSVALAGAGASVAVAARRGDAAAEVAALAGGRPVAWERGAIAAALEGCDLLVSAVSAGAGPLPVPAASLHPGLTVADLVYAPPTTPLLDAARAAGAPVLNGLGMLVEQAALSFELWTGAAPPVEIMSAAAISAIGSHPHGSSRMARPE